MRTLVKGGVWKNTEDEILKAAVMKYGKNQWSRISSLLVRKTAKQCKARWYEWLDPSIKKTEWSKEEDEKLLHLAKLMPCQWRTIAPIVGRTAAQCLYRYERLLDEAQGKERLAGEDDPRRLRPGEIDPAPEIKPARPDPVDMDEDEKEMLSEARARLANTQGKKAKRKAREKQLEEARRLASLQKKRELKAAGIEVHDHRNRKKRKNVDYNAEIPFHKPVPLGLYDTSEESRNTLNIQLTGKRVDQIEGKRRDEQEEEQRKRDLKRAKELEKSDPLLSIKLNKLTKESGDDNQRPKLHLPTPQITEGELEEIVKLGYEGETRKSVLFSQEHHASAALLGNYGSVAPTPLRTPRVAPSLDTVKLEAQNLAALQTMQTPLLGGANVSLHATSFEGATPRRQVQPTPSLLKNAFTPIRSTGPVAFSRLNETRPFQTPLNVSSSKMDMASPSLDYPNALSDSDSITQKSSSRGLLDGFNRLPRPRHEFEIEISDDTDRIEDQQRGTKLQGEADSGKGFAIQDNVDDDEAGHRHRIVTPSKSLSELHPKTPVLGEETHRKKTLLDIEHSSRLNRLMFNGLRLPKSLNSRMIERIGSVGGDPFLLVSPSSTTETNFYRLADQLIEREMLSILDLDVTRTVPAYQSSLGIAMDSVDAFEKDTLEYASLCIAEERKALENSLGFNPVMLDPDLYANCWQEISTNFVLSLKEKAYIRARTDPEKIIHLQHEFGNLRARLFKEAAHAVKTESKLQTLLAGYQSRSKSTLQHIAETYQGIEQTRIELSSMRHLHDMERESVPRRLETLEREVASLLQVESDMMTRYGDLLAQRDSLITARQVV